MLVTRDASAAATVECAVTIGNFDGVHRGHQAVLSVLVNQARERGLRSCVVTFEPHPREYFAPREAPARLSSLREKIESLDAAGVGQVHVCRFDAAFAVMTPEAFVEGLLVNRLRARWVMIGDDFRFGARRAGDLGLLRTLGREHGFDVGHMPTVAEGAVRISSTQVRQALWAGDLHRAAHLLGRRYSMSGRVVRGARLGRTLGFPTANLRVRHGRPPMLGIFVVEVHGVGARALPGVASLGYRPTVVQEGEVILEVHLLDFDQDIYGEHVRVEFLEKLRDEEKYPDLDTLKQRIARDVEQARRRFIAQ